MNNKYIENLIQFMDKSVCNFWAVQTVREMLEENGFSQLNVCDAWNVAPGGKYYVVKNHSAIFAFIVGNGDATSGFKIISSHSDSPCFRIKPNPEMLSDGGHQGVLSVGATDRA